MYLVGIDLSKFKHDCFIATQSGSVITNTFTFLNDFRGFNQLLAVLSSLDHSKEIRIGLEATRHYGSNLKIFLHDNGYSFMEFNPLLSERYRQASSLRKTKTDKIDAKIISKLLLVLDYKPHSLKLYHILSLKSLVRLRYRLVEARTKHKVRLQNVLDLTFPEYFDMFTAPFGETFMFLLSNFPTPKRLAEANFTDLAQKIYSISRGRFSCAKLQKLISLAKSSIGNCNELYEFQIKLILEQISSIEDQIASIMKQYNFPTASIKGVGLVSAASIVAEYGDFSLFATVAQILSFAGLEPAVYQSGTQSFAGRMVKRGSSYLRATLMNVSAFMIIHNPVFYQYYQKKRGEGKPHRVAISHVAKKLVRLIYTLEKNQVSYDSNLLK